MYVYSTRACFLRRLHRKTGQNMYCMCNMYTQLNLHSKCKNCFTKLYRQHNTLAKAISFNRINMTKLSQEKIQSVYIRFYFKASKRKYSKETLTK